MKIGICVVSYERPKYLYVSLDSIFRMHNIDDCIVSAFLIKNDTLADRINIISNFPVEVELTDLIGGDVFIYAFRVMFLKYNCDIVILFPDDALGRTDLIDYIASLDNPSGILLECFAAANASLGKAHPWVECMGGFAFFKDKFKLVDDYIDTPEFAALLVDNLRPGPFRFDIDYFLCKFMLEATTSLARYPPIPYGVGFGITGMHRANTAIYYEYEEKFFCREKENWLFNVVSCLTDKSIPDEIRNLWYPKDFKY